MSTIRQHYKVHIGSILYFNSHNNIQYLQGTRNKIMHLANYEKMGVGKKITFKRQFQRNIEPIKVYFVEMGQIVLF